MTDDKIGKIFWFEYHCYEGHDSCDAEIWYRSHQRVKVLSISESGYGDTPKERGEAGEPRVYKIRFNDGLEWDVFEDELMNSTEEFLRPNPPKKPLSESIRKMIREVFEEFFFEDINIPIEVGDEILGGRFKNKKIKVKEIGKNDKGEITINGKPLLKFRITKKIEGDTSDID